VHCSGTAAPGQRSGLWIGFLAGDERWWLLLPPPRFEPQALPTELWLVSRG
jgi:two-component system osmolarity sensor histidine kinase EnvZ